MKDKGQLVRIKNTTAQKLLGVQLLLSIQRQKVLTKSEAINALLDEFLNNHSIEK